LLCSPLTAWTNFNWWQRLLFRLAFLLLASGRARTESALFGHEGQCYEISWLNRLADHLVQYRIWQVLFRRRRRAEPRASEMTPPVRSDFHTVVTKAGVSVTFKPTNSTYIFVFIADNPVIARLGPLSFMGVQHGGRNTEDYNSDEVEAVARQVASEQASFHFGHFTD
jgi:hypothetical protein